MQINKIDFYEFDNDYINISRTDDGTYKIKIKTSDMREIKRSIETYNACIDEFAALTGKQV